MVREGAVVPLYHGMPLRRLLLSMVHQGLGGGRGGIGVAGSARAVSAASRDHCKINSASSFSLLFMTFASCRSAVFFWVGAVFE